MIVQEPVQAAIWHCLNHYDYQDAIFLAERLCAEVESEESVFLLATCYYRAGQKHQAHWLLSTKSVRSTQCRFLLSKCAFDLKKYSEAEHSLTNDDHLRPRHLDEIVKEFGDIACFALQLVSKICHKTERGGLANDASRKAVKLNPFLWHPFADLCHRGEKPDPDSIFQLTSTDIFQTSQAQQFNSVVLFGGPNNGGIHLPDAAADGCSLIGGSADQPTTPIDQCLGQNFINTPINQHPPQQGAPVLQGHTAPSAAAMRVGGGNLSADEQLHTPTYPFSDLGTPFRKQLKYLSTMSPSSPSFGVLPIVNTPTEPVAFLLTPSPQLVASCTPTGQQQVALLADHGGLVDPQSVAIQSNPKMALSSSNKKLRGGHHTSNLGSMGNILNRKHEASPHHHHHHHHQQQPAAIQLLQQQSTNTKPIVFSQTGNQMTTTPRTPNTTTAGALLQGQNVRRSSRLFSNSNYSVKENAKSPQLNNKFVAPRSPPRRTKQRISKTINNAATTLLENIPEKKTAGSGHEASREKIETITSTVGEGVPSLNEKVLLNNSINSAQRLAQQVLQLKKQSADGLMALLRELGHGYRRLLSYECEKAVETFSNVALHHYESSWVKSMIALAHHELRDYETAVQFFHDVHEREPHRLQYMEIYSTDLWHLQKDVVLSALARDLMAQDKTSPITWCVAGNCFSAHKEHETAIKFLFRAIQVDEEFAYSYALLGHDLVMTEELEKALSMYRLAVLHDPRNYNAWFGIGNVYCKQERHELAELHYRKALQINPRNSVIMVHIAVMQFYLRKAHQAIHTLNAAIALDPKNPQCKYHRGSMFFTLGRYQEALKELEELKQIVPKEAMVYYLMGKIYKKLGNVDLALMHLSWATDLGSKGANNQIKDNFDSIIRTQDGDGSVVEGGADAADTSSGAEDIIGGSGGGGGAGGGGSGGGGSGSGVDGSTTDGAGGTGADELIDEAAIAEAHDAEAGSSSIDPDYSLGVEQVSSDDSGTVAGMRIESLDVIANNFYDSDSY
ncbi:cell division cycle protein 27 homolog [Anopheles cruzii]|uniref:cell division cycle protein 27 homolog n=1 Tax=Anopheles cruzii TaxID=68878 RepID=UPI0022EC611E|nr:cell division cycle protein 27 homolog [Anopheles cruzii]